MKRILKTSSALLLIILVLASCSGKKDTSASISEKRTQLEKLKAAKEKNEAEMKRVQDELAKIDTASGTNNRIKLVAVTPVATEDFTHYIDLQGKVDADNISYVSPRGMGGQVKAVYVQQGQAVKKGQLLLKLDDAIMRQQVVAARQQLEGIKTQLALARNLYNRQKNLWDQGIGTEVQLITARTNVQSLENQLASGNEGVKVAVEQLNTANVYSDVSGIADVVNVRVGEMFTGGMMSGIKIVNTSSLKVVTSIPENYISRLRRGSPAEITIPDLGRIIKAPVSLISQSVDIANRGFVAEIKVPYDPMLKPNQSAKVRIMDYTSPKAIVIPVSVLQTDEKGKYVYVLEKLNNGKTIARKKSINIGEVYGNTVEVKTGLVRGELLITEGYQNVYEGQGITTELK